MRPFNTFCLAVASCAWLVGGAWDGAFAADHLDAPLASEDGRLDLNDLYVFQSPADPDNTVLIMTVNPFAGMMSETTFHPQADYQFLIDNNGDAEPDVLYSASFFANESSGRQDVLVEREDSSIAAFGGVGDELPVTGGGALRAGLFDDPFFFDLAGFQDGLDFTGVDAFAGANVSAIVLEIPSAELGDSNVGVWARTAIEGHQIDRMGRPAVNTVLIPTELKDAFNAGEPDHDMEDFGDEVRAAITALSGDADHAAALTDVLLPDLLTFDSTSNMGFLNGRRLADDVIDAELDLLTQGALLGDGVDANDVPFSETFPYLAPAHPVPEPTTFALALLAIGMMAGPVRRASFSRR